MTQLIAAAGISALLDLGCGSGSLLVHLARRSPRFRGFGIDSNPSMCRFARRAAREQGVARRVMIRMGNAENAERILGRRVIDSIDGIVGRSFLNACFRRGNADATEMLKQLRTLFPGRTAWFVDYYGELGEPSRGGPQRRLGVLQDVVQAISGQGLPPSDQKGWRAVYRKAGCEMVRSYDFDGDIRWFVHVVRF